MADEHDTTIDNDTEAVDETGNDAQGADGPDTSDGSADDEATAAPEAVGDDTEEADSADELKRAMRDMPSLNRRVAGRLTLVYPQRTVVVRCDGDAALRILAMVSGQSTGHLQDRLDPAKSTAFAGWLVIDPDLLTASWEPTWGSEPVTTRRRIVVDPVPGGSGDSDRSPGLLAAS